MRDDQGGTEKGRGDHLLYKQTKKKKKKELGKEKKGIERNTESCLTPSFWGIKGVNLIP